LLFDGVAVVLEAVLGFDLLFDCVILSLEGLSFLNKFLNVRFGESAFFVGDCDLLSFSSGFFHSRDVHDSISIDIKSDFNLWDTSWSGWNTIKVELSKFIVVLCHLSFTFEDLDVHTRLVISVGGEDLLLFSWDSGVSCDKSGHNTTSSFNTKRKWDDIKK